MGQIVWRVLGLVAIGSVCPGFAAYRACEAAPSQSAARSAPDGTNLGDLVDAREWAVRNTTPIDLGGQFRKATAILLRSVSPKGASGTGDPLHGVELLIVNDARQVLYRYSQAPHDPDFFVDDTLQAKDVTGDGVPELLFHSGVVGASDWWTHEHVIYAFPGKSFAQDIAPPEFGHSWRQTFRWITFQGATLALVAVPLSPQDPDDSHGCHGCPKFYQYLVFKWERSRGTFILLSSIQSKKDFDAFVDPLNADMALVRERLSKECQ